MESNRYRNLNEQIHVPAGLNERVLQAAGNQQAAKEKAGPFRREDCCGRWFAPPAQWHWWPGP